MAKMIHTKAAVIASKVKGKNQNRLSIDNLSLFLLLFCLVYEDLNNAQVIFLAYLCFYVAVFFIT